MNNGECSPLQCCESPKTTSDNITDTSPQKIHFHRRSSVGLSSVDLESESKNDV
jgi:hypothetical protein